MKFPSGGQHVEIDCLCLDRISELRPTDPCLFHRFRRAWLSYTEKMKKTYTASACFAGLMFSCFLWYLMATAKAGRVDGTEVIVRDTFDQVNALSFTATCQSKLQWKDPNFVRRKAHSCRPS